MDAQLAELDRELRLKVRHCSSLCMRAFVSRLRRYGGGMAEMRAGPQGVAMAHGTRSLQIKAGGGHGRPAGRTNLCLFNTAAAWLRRYGGGMGCSTREGGGGSEIRRRGNAGSKDCGLHLGFKKFSLAGCELQSVTNTVPIYSGAQALKEWPWRTGLAPCRFVGIRLMPQSLGESAFAALGALGLKQSCSGFRAV
jgi:hypothetical protein